MPSIVTNRRADRAELDDFMRPRHHGVLLTTRADGWPQSSLVTMGPSPSFQPPFARPSPRGTLEGSILLHPAQHVENQKTRATPCCGTLRRATAARSGRGKRCEREAATGEERWGAVPGRRRENAVCLSYPL